MLVVRGGFGMLGSGPQPFSEPMKTEFSTELPAPPERVFYWLDDAERVKRWIPNVVENVDLEVTPDRVGSTFRQVFDEKGRKMIFNGRVLAYEANRRLHLFMEGEMFDLDIDYRLEDLGGKTRLTQDSTAIFKSLLWKILGPPMCLFMKKAAMKEMEQNMQRLGELAASDEL